MAVVTVDRLWMNAWWWETLVITPSLVDPESLDDMRRRFAFLTEARFPLMVQDPKSFLQMTIS